GVQLVQQVGGVHPAGRGGLGQQPLQLRAQCPRVPVERVGEVEVRLRLRQRLRGEPDRAERDRLGPGQRRQLLVHAVLPQPARTTSVFLSSDRSTTTSSPSRICPLSRDFASWSPIAVWISRRSGRAPYTGSYPLPASHSRAASVTCMVSRRSASRRARLASWMSTMALRSSRVRAENTTRSSSRLRNSGLKWPRTTASTASRRCSSVSVGSAMIEEPRLD